MPQIINFLIYHYVPSLWANSTFASLFLFSAIVHSYQAYRSRYWVFFPTLVLGALLETLGYAGRIWSARDVYQLTPYLMQIVLLSLSPVYFSAFLYIVLGMAINRLGQQYSVLTPRTYFITFILADLISLILQSIGGGQAASGAAKGAPTQSATDVMVAGIIFQLCTMAIFICCGIDFAIRYKLDRPWAFRLRQMAAQSAQLVPIQGVASNGSGESTPADEEKAMVEQPAVGKVDDARKWRLIAIGTTISSAMIILRGIFRSVELYQGWSGYLISRGEHVSASRSAVKVQADHAEAYQAALDGIPMVICVGILNVLHPGLILGRKASWKGYY